MKITFGKRIAKTDGKTTFDVSHKWGKWSYDDQAVMVMLRIFDKYPDSENFEWFADSSGICAGRCNLNKQQ